MGSSPFNLLEQNTRSASSFAPMNGSTSTFLSSASDHASNRKPKSYLNKRQRSKGKRETEKDNASVKDSLAKFLADSQDEDLLFVNTKADDGGDPSSATKQGNGGKTNHQSDDDIMSVQSDVLFDRIALNRAGTRRTRIYQPKPRRSMDSMEANNPTNTRERPRRKLEGRRPRVSRNSRESKKKERKSTNDDNNNDGEIALDGNPHHIHDHEKSASSLGFDDAESCASSVVSKEKRSSSRQVQVRTSSLKDNHTNVRKRTTRRVRSSDLSGMSTSGMKRTGTRTRAQRHSLASGLQDTEVSGVKRKGKKKQVSSRSQVPSLAAGLQDLDRQNAKDRMKDKYSSSRSADGGESLVSNMSYKSTRTSSTVPTKSTYKSSGLEGGALSAFMGIEHIARDGKPNNRSSGGASVVSTPADQQYMRERKAQQDLILDVAAKERLQDEVNATLEAERLEKERRGSKKKGFVNKMKARASNSMLAKASAKEVANALMDPKRILRKGKRGSGGSNATGNGISSDANGDFDATKKERKTDLSANTDIIFDPDDTSSDHEEILDDYDSRALSDRQTFRGTFAERLSLSDSTRIKNSKKQTSFRRFSSPSEIPVPALGGEDWEISKDASDLWGH